MTCQTCSQDHPKCAGHVTKDPTTRQPIDPRPCAKAPMKGQRVCATHGGSAPQSRQAAERREQEAAAEETIRRLWPGLAEARVVKDPVASMERLAGALEQLVDEAGDRVNDLRHLAGGEHLTQLRAEVVLLERALGHLRGLLVDMARLGIAERHVELEQAKVSVIVAALHQVLNELQLVPADRDRAIRSFLRGLGRGPESGDVVAGEVSA